MDLSWMGWTPFTATFFGVIALLILSMIVWERLSPGGAPRDGILWFETTRGDRLFISLLGSGFIHLGWLYFMGADALWWALGLSILYALAVFRWV